MQQHSLHPRHPSFRGTICAIASRFAIIASLALTGCSAGGARGINVTGSTSVSPFAEHLAELFEKEQPGEGVNIQSLGSSAGIQAAISGVAEIGMSSRELKPEESAKLDQTEIARDALAIVVHPSNSVGALTTKQIVDIFSGVVTDWSQVGGRPGRITLIVREAGSGTNGAFAELVMKKAVVSQGALRQGSNGAIRQIVAQDPGSIGYISLGIVDGSIKAVSVDSVAPSVEAVLAKKYKFVRPFLFVWQKGKPPAGRAKAYLDYVLGAPAQQELRQLGLVPIG